MTTISNYPAPRSTIPPPLVDALETLAGASWAPPPNPAARMSESLAPPAIPREFAEEASEPARAAAAEPHAGWTLLWMQQGALSEWRVKRLLVAFALSPALACVLTAAACLYYVAAPRLPVVVQAAQLLVPGQPLGMGLPTGELLTDGERIERSRDEARRLARRIGLGSMPAVNRIYLGHPDPAWVRAAGEHAQVPTSLLWPVEGGGFVRGYGSGEAGYHLAMDISGKLGWDVRASAGGIVGYAGDRLRGYGNIIMLIHPGGWITVYAHNQRNYVATGQRVQAGDVIAALGSTGISRGPHVHFEFIHHGMNCDSAPLMRPGVMHRSGYQSEIPKLDWAAPGPRPRGVACGRRRYHPRSRWHRPPGLAALEGHGEPNGEAMAELENAAEVPALAAQPQAAAEVEPTAQDEQAAEPVAEPTRAAPAETDEGSAPEARTTPAALPDTVATTSS